MKNPQHEKATASEEEEAAVQYRSMEHHYKYKYKIEPPFQHLRRGIKGTISLEELQVMSLAGCTHVAAKPFHWVFFILTGKASSFISAFAASSIN